MRGIRRAICDGSFAALADNGPDIAAVGEVRTVRQQRSLESLKKCIIYVYQRIKGKKPFKNFGD